VVPFMAVFLLILALAGVAALVAHALAAHAFRVSADRLITALRSAADRPREPVALPPLVEAYAARAAMAGSDPTVVEIRQAGTMRLRPGGTWRPMTATHVMSATTTDFVWFADVEILPLVFVRVLDAHVGGKGVMEVRLFGSLPLVRKTGPEVDRGELQRYLAELAWVPHAVRRNAALRWTMRDDNVVEVRAGEGASAAGVDLIFEYGDLSRVEADDRPHSVAGRIVPSRWLGRFFDYAQTEAGYLPRRAEASWLLPDGPFAYWRGELTAYAASAAADRPKEPPRLQDWVRAARAHAAALIG
jgi:hypothetical protein